MRAILIAGLFISVLSPVAEAADKESLVREIARVRTAIDVGTDRQEMTALAKAVIVELYMAKRAGISNPQTESSTLVLIDALRATVTNWDLCPEAVWKTNFPSCKQASTEFFKSIGSLSTAYDNSRLPWKPFYAYALVEVSARADEALSTFR
ncbi:MULTISPECIES: hypothetical protein [Azospirillum]|uniref:Uncharacterized protein n=1 Tax=Azospirillum brasilense TaxID=192 RepID=A0ABU4NY79_AZOBR|nr:MULTISPECIES: hypothetical protein [Azospirillum]YP_001686887.1 hypothetical protein APCd_gp46 [Azospirillum phage Cd]MDW7555370.1 hypothetical protein [Azospirillum brasilense]MDW7595222.1 hypothetical protein [Azospirillum brasilense]MDW7630375.1 hypothetical protein [Azospirillum brasilense]MDX5949743.1 hypothetical protein [Azospirillum brasilense]OPH16874.1 hypothetical protein FE89_02640 [Azospirillum brasilense]